MAQPYIVLHIYYKIVNRVKRLRIKNTLKHEIDIIDFYIFILSRVQRTYYVLHEKYQCEVRTYTYIYTSLLQNDAVNLF